MLQSLDGFIAHDSKDKLEWGSKEDKKNFQNLGSQIGVLIMGRTTYDSLPKFLKEDKIILVFTSKPEEVSDGNQILGFSGDVRSGIQLLEEKGIKHAALVGGGNLNGQFLEAGLIDELYLTIAPIMFGKGIRTFGESNADMDLRLIKFDENSSGELNLYYKKDDSSR